MDVFMKQLFVFLFVVITSAIFAQNCSFKEDTVFIASEKKTVNTEYLETTLKNNSKVQLIKAPKNKLFVKLIVKENLYFNKVDQLEIKSGTKSFYAKDTKQHQLDKYTGYYLVEIYKNYAGTLKEDGITSIVFGKTETSFAKSDCVQIKEISKCFYESIAAKK